MKRRWKHLIHRAFQVGILTKGIDGVVELGCGATLLFTSNPAIKRFVRVVTHGELIEDPHDFVANLLVNLSEQLAINTQHFAGVYLILHGLINISLAVGLLRNVTWSYPVALVLLLLFIVYQVYRVIHIPSITLTVVTALDLLVVVLIYFEWQDERATNRELV